ncbi:MAG TPA: hypothetical protein VHA52_10680 [Candidatus Babeliaceae bacterium]|nr:hypothetical protein [Candidatus Babeliaceae bacterium]
MKRLLTLTVLALVMMLQCSVSVNAQVSDETSRHHWWQQSYQAAKGKAGKAFDWGSRNASEAYEKGQEKASEAYDWTSAKASEAYNKFKNWWSKSFSSATDTYP